MFNAPNYPTKLEPQAPDIDARLTRIETRLVKLMQHLGLQADGSPAPTSTHEANRPFTKPWTAR